MASVAAAVILAACGGDGVDLSADASLGREVADRSGCLACHGSNGQGGVGPGWRGLAGSTRDLQDGRTVVADTAYLERSIRQPDEDLVDGFTVKMPQSRLSDEEVRLLIAYIEELA